MTLHYYIITDSTPAGEAIRELREGYTRHQDAVQAFRKKHRIPPSSKAMGHKRSGTLFGFTKVRKGDKGWEKSKKLSYFSPARNTREGLQASKDLESLPQLPFQVKLSMKYLGHQDLTRFAPGYMINKHASFYSNSKGGVCVIPDEVLDAIGGNLPEGMREVTAMEFNTIIRLED